MTEWTEKDDAAMRDWCNGEGEDSAMLAMLDGEAPCTSDDALFAIGELSAELDAALDEVWALRDERAQRSKAEANARTWQLGFAVLAGCVLGMLARGKR